VGAAIALAQSGTKQTFKATLTSNKPNKVGSTTLTLSASDPTNTANQNQPDPARKIDIALAKGLKLDTGATGKCSASDLDFQNKGDAACPKNTQVATGSAVVNTGLNPPVTRINATVKGYNGGSKLILYVVPQGAQPLVIRASITGKPKSGQHIVANVTPNCIPPGKPTDTPPCQGKEAPIETFILTTLNKHKGSGSSRHDVVTTPPTCPKAGWVFGVKVTFRSIPAQDVTTKVACRK